jgi:hypothetical protein
MEAHELKDLMTKKQLISTSFNGYQFDLLFEGGLVVEVGCSTDGWDNAIWEIDSSEEKEERLRELQARTEAEKQLKIDKAKKLESYSNKLSKEELSELVKLVGGRI